LSPILDILGHEIRTYDQVGARRGIRLRAFRDLPVMEAKKTRPPAACFLSDAEAKHSRK